MKKLFRLSVAALALSASAWAPAQTLLNASYDVAREFYKDYNAAFIANYKKTTGKDVKIDQSHGGSSAQARAVNDGLDADVVTMNTTTDVDFLASTGIVAKDWAKRFPYNASPTYVHDAVPDAQRQPQGTSRTGTIWSSRACR
jgi:sulfate transport system substrate-binding protein